MKNTKTRVTGIVMFLLALFVAFIMIVPFVWMVSASFKLKKEIFSVPIRWIPETFHMDNYEFDNDFDWNIKACNTAFCVIKNEKLLRYYTDKSIEFMRHTSEQNDRLAYMVFAEQRMLPMCAKKLNMSIMSFSDLNRLFKNGDNMFTHTWGMKQQMRDNAFLRADFCRRCIKRIIKDYPEMKNIIMNIENLKQYF